MRCFLGLFSVLAPWSTSLHVNKVFSDYLTAASTPLRPLHTNANDLCKVESSPIRLLPVPLLTQLKRRMLTRVLRARSSPASGLLARPTFRVWNPPISDLVTSQSGFWTVAMIADTSCGLSHSGRVPLNMHTYRVCARAYRDSLRGREG